MWRTGLHTRSEPVQRMHELTGDERLLGWLYVGGRPSTGKSGRRKPVNAKEFLTSWTE
jgi:hypothetical protein